MMRDGECALARTFQYGGEKIAVRVDTFFSHHDQSAGERRIGGRYRERLQAAIMAQLVAGDEIWQAV